MALIPQQVLSNVTTSQMFGWDPTYLEPSTLCSPTDSSSIYAYNGTTWIIIGSQPPTTAGQIMVGAGSGNTANVSISGGGTLSSTGAFTLSNSAVLTALNTALGTNLQNGVKFQQYALISTTFSALNAGSVTLVNAVAGKSILPLFWMLVPTTGFVGVGLFLRMGYTASQAAVATIPITSLGIAQTIVAVTGSAFTQTGITSPLPVNTALTIGPSAASLTAGALNVYLVYDLV